MRALNVDTAMQVIKVVLHVSIEYVLKQCLMQESKQVDVLIPCYESVSMCCIFVL